MNDNEVSVTGILEIETTLNEKVMMLDWWEVRSETCPIQGMDNFAKLELRIVQGKEEKIGFVKENPEIQELRSKLAEKFEELFSRQRTVRNFNYGVRFKSDIELFQQKGRKIPLHIQPAVRNELHKLLKSGNLTKLQQVVEDICVSPAVIARKSDGSVKITLDAKELNKRIVKKKMQTPNLDDLRDRMSIKDSENATLQFWDSTIDLDYAFGLVELDKETAKHCVIAIVGGNCTGHHQFNRGFYGLARGIPRQSGQGVGGDNTSMAR